MTAQKTILVVEPDHQTRVEVRNTFENAGYFVVSATNGADALSLLEKISTPSVVLLNLDLPVMTAEQFLLGFQSHAHHRGVPVVQICADTHQLLPGVGCAITKPLDQNALLKVVEDCLS